MLFHWLKEPNTGVDIEQLVVHLPEPINSTKLRAACERLVSHHEILRARFEWENLETPQQEILEMVNVPFEVIDGGAESETHRKSRLERFLREDRIQGFDLNSAPLLRFTLVQWSSSSFSLVWTFHHALLDGRCYPILLRELFEAYENPSVHLTPRSSDFAFGKHVEWLQKQDQTLSRNFWRTYLDSFTAPTPLTIDHKASNVEFPQGETWERLDAATTSILRRYAETNDLTMNSVVMGAWSILLHRYSGETDIVFGATRACRKSSGPEAADGIGLYINTIPVRAKLSEDVRVSSVLHDLRRQWLAFRAVEHTPLAFIRSQGQVPVSELLFETLVVFEKYRLDEAMRSLGGKWTGRGIDLHELTNFPITLAAYGGEELAFKMEFDRRRVSEEAAQRMLGHLCCLMEGIAANPSCMVGDLRLLKKDEERILVEEFNRPEAAFPEPQVPLNGEATLHRLFEVRVCQQPDRPALTCDGVSLTYAELNRQANRLAHHLISSGVGPDSLVGLSLERSSNLVIAIIAVLKAGGAYVPIDLAYPAERLKFIVDDAQASVLITEKKLASSLPATNARVICIDEPEDEKRAQVDENPSTGTVADNLAYVIYTSGTTGKPKGTLITHRNVTRLFSVTEHWFHFDHSDVWTLFHSSAFDFSVWEIWGALLYGGRLVVVPFLTSRSPETFYELLERERITVLNQTPSAFRQLIRVDASKDSSELQLRYVIFGGEALEMESLRPWFARHGDKKPQLINMYGITETTVHVTYRPLSKNDLDSGSVIGIPIPDLRVYILDSRGRPVPIGVPGEMYVGGAGLAQGYLRRPDLTEHKFLPNPFEKSDGARLYRTGDLARFLPGKEIEYLGRIDDQVKIRGFRIELGEIESVLRQHSEVREVSVMAREVTPGSKQLVAYIVASTSRIEHSELRDFLKKKLPDYMVPAAFVFLSSMPLTNNGKIDRKALPMPEPERPELTEQFLAPRNEIEETLARIWTKVLRVEKVGVKDNFFELGGDSILSIQILALARRQNIRVTPKQLFDHQTIEQLSRVAAIDENKRTLTEDLSGEFPLTPIQSWFFEQNLQQASYYNQAFLLDVSIPLDPDRLAQAMRAVESHHDALRLRFTKLDGHWRQHYSPNSPGDGRRSLDVVDLSDVATELREQAIRAACVKAQAGLNIANGPTWCVVYFQLGVDQPAKFLVAVHHLAVDGVSWRPLLEDLETAYMQIAKGSEAQLPAKTTSFKSWANELVKYASSNELKSELSYWMAEHSTAGESRADTESPLATIEAGREQDAVTLVHRLSALNTRKLLQQAPGFYGSQINDVLLAAFAMAWRQWSGNNVVDLFLEGHGREVLLRELDLSRTIGWFTSIYPVRIEVPANLASVDAAGAVSSVRMQLQRIPRKGIGYGVLRYLSDGEALAEVTPPKIIFNYLGQLDRALSDSTIFRFAKEDCGPWHSPAQRRRYAVEVNCAVVNGEFEICFTVPESSQSSLRHFALSFGQYLDKLIDSCQEQPTRSLAPSDFTLVSIDQAALDRLLQKQLELEDVCPLSPGQSLYFLANPVRLSTGFDQWHCSLEGDLQIPLFERAWRETINRHSILRSSIQSEGVKEPLQVVAKRVEPPWELLDWSSQPLTKVDSLWTDYLNRDRLRPLDLSTAPVMRFALARIPENRWKFLWSLPALFLDGWSWPLVFREASLRYKALLENNSPQLDPAPQYRDYLSWLRVHPQTEAHDFWTRMLADFASPTRLPQNHTKSRKAAKSLIHLKLDLERDTWKVLQDVSRRLRLTPGTLIQAAWALLLAQKNRSTDVVYGAAFSGRPAELENAEYIVGPFVNSLPVRIRLQGAQSLAEYLQHVHQLLVSIGEYQFQAIAEIQQFSRVPRARRLFDSLVVFQNYQIPSEALFFGGRVPVTDFAGPIHTNYPLLLLAEPGKTLELTLIYDAGLLSAPSVEQWGRDVSTLLNNLAYSLDSPLTDLWARLSAALDETDSEQLPGANLNYVPPQSKSEIAIAAIWRDLFGLERVGVEENFFDLGGHSLLLLQMHRALQEKLYPNLSVVTLFENPTVRSLARYMDDSAGSSGTNGSTDSRARAQRQRGALQQMRDRLKKSVS